jgi:alkylmercury lyase-like protein
MLLFRSEEHAGHWREAHGFPDARTLSLETGWKLARAWYARKLDPEWRRHTVEEAEALFAELGLAGDFWRLR